MVVVVVSTGRSGAAAALHVPVCKRMAPSFLVPLLPKRVLAVVDTLKPLLFSRNTVKERFPDGLRDKFNQTHVGFTFRC